MSKKGRHCLNCCKSVNRSYSFSNSADTVGNQVRAIFVLRKLFNISSFDCSEILRNETTNPSSWLCFCQKCFAAIVQAERVFRRLIKLELKWSGLKNSFLAKFEHGNPTNATVNDKEDISSKIRELAQLAVKEALTELDKCTAQEDQGFSADGIKDEIKQENFSDNEREDFIDIETAGNDIESLDLDKSEASKSDFHNDTNAMVTTEPAKKVRRSRSGRIIKPRNIKSHYTDSDSTEFDEPAKTYGSCIENEDEVTQDELLGKVTHREEKSKNFSNLEENFKCSFCRNVYSNENGKNEHENRSHGTNHFFRCTDCDKVYCTLFVLYRHCKEVHCTEPEKNHGRVYEDPLRRKKMRAKKGVPKPSLECDRCNKVLAHREALHYHQRHCGKKRNIICSHCDAVFFAEHKLKLHIYKKHDPSQLPYPCLLCDKKYTSPANLRKHSRNIHLKQRNFICEICSEDFTEYKLLQQHQKRKHGDQDQLNELRCKECSKVMCTPSALRNHILVVHKRQFKLHCPICNVGRISQSALDSHVLVAHTNYERPYACTVCKKSYLTNSVLKSHMRIHSGEKPYQCKYCKKAFHTLKRLKRHEKQVHVPDGTSFECPTCHKTFRSQHSKVNHIYITHNKKVSTIPPKQIVDPELLKGLVLPISNTNPANRGNQFRQKIEERFKNPSQEVPTNENETTNSNYVE